MGREISSIKDHIRNMLTLRYDPSEAPLMKHKTWKDMTPDFEFDKMKLTGMLENTLANLAEYDHIGIGLSSGMDSGLLLAMIRNLFPKMKITAIHYEGIHNELRGTKFLADKYDAKLVLISNNSILDKIQWMVQVTHDFHWDSFDYLVAEIAHEMDCEALVTGDGADEVFGGYSWRYDNLWDEKVPTNTRFMMYMDGHNRDWVPDQKDLFGPEIDFWWDKIEYHFKTCFLDRLEPINQMMLADFNGKLLHLFMKKANKFAEVYQIPIINPYLDPYIVNYGLHLSPDVKIRNGLGKIPLREVAHIQELHFPAEKIGFSHDTVADWNSDKWEEANEDLTDPKNEMFTRGYISYEWVLRHANSADRYDVAYVNKFMQLLCLEQWLRVYID